MLTREEYEDIRETFLDWYINGELTNENNELISYNMLMGMIWAVKKCIRKNEKPAFEHHAKFANERSRGSDGTFLPIATTPVKVTSTRYTAETNDSDSTPMTIPANLPIKRLPNGRKKVVIDGDEVFIKGKRGRPQKKHDNTDAKAASHSKRVKKSENNSIVEDNEVKLKIVEDNEVKLKLFLQRWGKDPQAIRQALRYLAIFAQSSVKPQETVENAVTLGAAKLGI